MGLKGAQRRFCVMAGFSAVLAAMFYIFLYAPQWEELQTKEAEASELRRVMAEAAAFRKNHPDPAKEQSRAEVRKRLVTGLLPPRLEQGAFLTETEKRAAAVGVKLLGVLPGDGAEMGGVVRAPVRLSVRGEFFSLLDFLYSLEQRGRFVKIDAVRGKTDDVGVFTGTVELWIYARSL